MTQRISAPPRIGRRGAAAVAIALALAVGADVPRRALGQQMTPGSVIFGGFRGSFRMTQRQGGFQFTGPAINSGALAYSAQSGLQIDWQANESGQFGYWPVEFTVSTAKAAARDRQIRVQFYLGNWGRDGEAMTVDQSFTLKKDALAGRTTLVVPRYVQWPLCGWKVWVDGQLDEDLSAKNINLPQQQVNVGVAALLATTAFSPWEFQSALQTIGNGSSTCQTAQQRDLPEEWTHYSAIDVVILPADELPKLSAQFPRQMTALVRWLRAGGNLWLVDVSADWRQLDEAERALGFRAASQNGDDVADDESPDGDSAEDESAGEPAISAAADAALVARGWKFVDLGERALEPVDGALELSNYDIDEEPAPRPRGPRDARGLPSPITSDAPASTSQKWFAVRALGLGTVTAFRANLRDAQVQGGPVPGGWQQPGFGDPSMMGATGRGVFSGEYGYGDPSAVPVETAVPTQMTEAQKVHYAVQRSLLMPRVNWTMRHGNKPDEANAEFNNWLIPGVGVAPVGQFQILITLFVLAIGPLNYWWLKRRKKLPMLLATVPAAAAVVTLLLLAFGVLADGLGARVRARSFTVLDQSTGESASWTRLSYYAGISPKDGLELPRDTVVYPVMSNWAERRAWRGNAFKRTMAWDDEQRLTSGWLMSRTPTQYLAVAARPTRKRLELRTTDDGLRIVNRLGVTVTHAAVQDHDGRLYWCEDLAADAGRVVSAVEADEISGRLRRLFIDNYPEYPAGAESLMYGGGFYGMMLSKSLMEAQIDAINSPIIRSWEDGGYIAVTDRGVDLDLGLDNATEEGSFHVIRGKW